MHGLRDGHPHVRQVDRLPRRSLGHRRGLGRTASAKRSSSTAARPSGATAGSRELRVGDVGRADALRHAGLLHRGDRGALLGLQAGALLAKHGGSCPRLHTGRACRQLSRVSRCTRRIDP